MSQEKAENQNYLQEKEQPQILGELYLLDDKLESLLNEEGGIFVFEEMINKQRSSKTTDDESEWEMVELAEEVVIQNSTSSASVSSSSSTNMLETLSPASSASSVSTNISSINSTSTPVTRQKPFTTFTTSENSSTFFTSVSSSISEDPAKVKTAMAYGNK